MSRPQALEIALYEAGLLQFGLFARADGARPFQHQLSMLASYPQLLRELARLIAPRLHNVDRLLCPEEFVALAVAVALEADIPLVIGRGDGSNGPRDLVGAFDIGHPAALIVLTLDSISKPLLDHAHRFGLEVAYACALLEIAPAELPIPATAVLNLTEVTAQLVADKQLPAGQGRAVESWLAEGATRRRPD